MRQKFLRFGEKTRRVPTQERWGFKTSGLHRLCGLMLLGARKEHLSHVSELATDSHDRLEEGDCKHMRQKSLCLESGRQARDMRTQEH